MLTRGSVLKLTVSTFKDDNIISSNMKHSNILYLTLIAQIVENFFSLLRLEIHLIFAGDRPQSLTHTDIFLPLNYLPGSWQYFFSVPNSKIQCKTLKKLLYT